MNSWMNYVIPHSGSGPASFIQVTPWLKTEDLVAVSVSQQSTPRLNYRLGNVPKYNEIQLVDKSLRKCTENPQTVDRFEESTKSEPLCEACMLMLDVSHQPSQESLDKSVVQSEVQPVEQERASKSGRKKRKRTCYTIDPGKAEGQVLSYSNTECDGIPTDGVSLDIAAATSWKLSKTRTSLNLELAASIGLSSDDLKSDKVLKRQKVIRQKVTAGYLHFTQKEEYDIYCRAENHITSVYPDPEYYVISGGTNCVHIPDAEKEISGMQTRPLSAFGDQQNSHKRSCVIDVQHTEVMTWEAPHSDPVECVVLKDGTQVFRPPAKLVELVAQALSDSPDGMLQVQQIYTCLQHRYPFFQFLDKPSMTSWRSSIRHALYQRWFHKIRFKSDFMAHKGSYWALNRKHEPKEWVLPRLKSDLADASGEVSNLDFSQAGDQCIPSDSWATTNGDCSFAKTTLYDQCIPSPTREASTHYQDHETWGISPEEKKFQPMSSWQSLDLASQPLTKTEVPAGDTYPSSEQMYLISDHDNKQVISGLDPTLSLINSTQTSDTNEVVDADSQTERGVASTDSDDIEVLGTWTLSSPVMTPIPAGRLTLECFTPLLQPSMSLQDSGIMVIQDYDTDGTE